jgi:hypothetical protein
MLQFPKEKFRSPEDVINSTKGVTKGMNKNVKLFIKRLSLF